MKRSEVKRLLELLAKLADRGSATNREKQLIHGVVFCAQRYGRDKLDMDYAMPSSFLRAKANRPMGYTDGDVLRAWLHKYDDIDGIILHHDDGRKHKIRKPSGSMKENQ